jgi:hypothetical protein
MLHGSFMGATDPRHCRDAEKTEEWQRKPLEPMKS